MKSLNRGAILISCCAAVIIVSSLALYREMTGRIEKNAGDSIGTIVFKKKTAVRKYAEFVIWEDIANNSPVFNYDSIRTYAESAAYIRLNNGAEISLDENTMIVLVIDDAGVKINFDQGSVSAKSGSDRTGTISLNTRDASISMDEGELAIRKDDKTTDVNVYSGNAVLESGGDEKKIDNTTGAKIVDGKAEIKKVTILTEYPSNNMVFITSAPRGKVQLKWKSDSGDKSVVEVSASPVFDKTIIKESVKGQSYAAGLAAGDYYWRVSSGGGISAVRKFSILRDSPVEFFYPSHDEKIIVTGDDPVKFRWSGSEYADNFTFEVATDPGMKNVVTSIMTKISSIAVDKQGAGSFWWRVKRNYPEGFVDLDSMRRPVAFKVERRAVSRAKPKPFNDTGMSASALASDLSFNWEGCRGVDNYIVEISADSGFNKIVKSERTGATFLRAEMLPEGIYFWRVKAEYGSNDFEISEKVSLRITRPEPVVYTSPRRDSGIDSNDPVINFKWKDTSDSGNYLFELAADDGFKKILSSVKVHELKYDVKNPGFGKFFWRVSITDGKGRPVVKGDTAVFIIKEGLGSPALRSPENDLTINIESVDVLVFEWEKVNGADSYELEIFHNASGSEKSLIVMNSKTTKIEIRNFAFLEPGTITWVVRAQKKSHGRVTESSESERRSFTLKVRKELPAPEAKTGDTIYVR